MLLRSARSALWPIGMRLWRLLGIKERKATILMCWANSPADDSGPWPQSATKIENTINAKIREAAAGVTGRRARLACEQILAAWVCQISLKPKQTNPLFPFV